LIDYSGFGASCSLLGGVDPLEEGSLAGGVGGGAGGVAVSAAALGAVEVG
jgi:hypothetical protein